MRDWDRDGPRPRIVKISAKRLQWVLPGEVPQAAALPDLAAVGVLARDLSLPPPIALLSARRGLLDIPSAAAFLKPEFKSLHAPALLPNIQSAVARIRLALARQEPITLFGDYDVDGISGTVVPELLKAAGAGYCSARLHPPPRRRRLRGFLPRHRKSHRRDEKLRDLGDHQGFRIVRQFRIPHSAFRISPLPQGGGLIITIDCGVSALRAHRLGPVPRRCHHHRPPRFYRSAAPGRRGRPPARPRPMDSPAALGVPQPPPLRARGWRSNLPALALELSEAGETERRSNGDPPPPPALES